MIRTAHVGTQGPYPSREGAELTPSGTCPPAPASLRPSNSLRLDQLRKTAPSAQPASPPGCSALLPLWEQPPPGSALGAAARGARASQGPPPGPFAASSNPALTSYKLRARGVVPAPSWRHSQTRGRGQSRSTGRLLTRQADAERSGLLGAAGGWGGLRFCRVRPTLPETPPPRLPDTLQAPRLLARPPGWLTSSRS